jgi:iron complex transport system permease protein
MPSIVILFAAITVVSLLFGIGLGPVTVSPGNVAKILLSRIPGIGEYISQSWAQLDENIIIGLRLP